MGKTKEDFEQVRLEEESKRESPERMEYLVALYIQGVPVDPNQQTTIPLDNTSK